jgi:hypothetical protein
MIKNIIISEIQNILSENNSTSSPTNNMTFWHGGNLDEYNEIISQKNGRYEFGAGLYLTTHYDTALKYSKGSRKLYLVTVEKGNDINNTLLEPNIVKDFINSHIIGNKKNMLWNRLQNYMKDNKIKAYVFDNIILNEKAIKATNTKYLRQFYIDNDIDYNMVSNAFGWGEKMMVLYNMKKIINIKQVKSTDKIENYDLPTDFN